MIVLGLILLLIGLLVVSTVSHLLVILGIILVVVGAVLNFVPLGNSVGPRRRWY